MKRKATRATALAFLVFALLWGKDFVQPAAMALAQTCVLPPPAPCFTVPTVTLPTTRPTAVPAPTAVLPPEAVPTAAPEGVPNNVQEPAYESYPSEGMNPFAEYDLNVVNYWYSQLHDWLVARPNSPRRPEALLQLDNWVKQMNFLKASQQPAQDESEQEPVIEQPPPTESEACTAARNALQKATAALADARLALANAEHNDLAADAEAAQIRAEALPLQEALAALEAKLAGETDREERRSLQTSIENLKKAINDLIEKANEVRRVAAEALKIATSNVEKAIDKENDAAEQVELICGDAQAASAG